MSVKFNVTLLPSIACIFETVNGYTFQISLQVEEKQRTEVKERQRTETEWQQKVRMHGVLTCTHFVLLV